MEPKFQKGQRVRCKFTAGNVEGEVTFVYVLKESFEYEVRGADDGCHVFQEADLELCSYVYKVDLNKVKFKASHENRTFESGAVRDKNTNKPFIHCLLGYTRQRFGYHMAKNASKYGEFNFLKGIPTSVYLESIDRHLAAYMENDRTEDHLSAILFGVQGCMINEQKEGVSSSAYFQNF